MNDAPTPGAHRDGEPAPGDRRATAPVTVTVAIPLLDDRDGIGPCLDAVGNQALGGRAGIVEVLVMDGGSRDGSRDEVLARAEADPRIRLLENPDRHVPSAMNLAITAARGDVIVRIDSHTVVAPDYVATAVDVLEATAADVIGGPMRPAGTTPFGEAVAWALQSRWGIGGSRFHRDDYEGPTDGVYMGVFPRATFERFGGFDTRFTRNQDDELTYRIRSGGGTVWLTPALHSVYEPRATAQGLARQFFGYGRYKPMVLALHPDGLRLRHLAPPAVAAAWVAAAAAGAIGAVAAASARRGRRTRRGALVLATAPAAAHAVAVIAASWSGAGRWRDRAAALAVMHVAYGAGFWRGLGDGMRLR